MLKSLQIRNYILIKELNIEFDDGFITITGETGAGKSILIGAINLLLGQRADTTVLLDKKTKCVIEGGFDIHKHKLEVFFTANDIEYDHYTIIRREILDSGKSRAFINDTPVNLSLLKELAQHLIDIHSQHESLLLNSSGFQLDIVDALAGNRSLMHDFKTSYEEYKQLSEELRLLREEAARAMQEYDYNLFQFEELNKAAIVDGEIEELEKEYEQLTHVEEIKSALHKAIGLLSDNEFNIIALLKETSNHLSAVSKFSDKSLNISERIVNLLPEIKDILFDISQYADAVQFDPERLNLIKARLDLLNNLLYKHRVENTSQLIAIKNKLNEKISKTHHFTDQIESVEKKLGNTLSDVKDTGQKITQFRKKIIPDMEKIMNQLLKDLGIPYADFKVDMVTSDQFTSSGFDKIQFLFSANKNILPMPVEKIASGGEISRLMLALKYIVANKLQLPAVIFDEIDAGVSGEIAEKMANLMKQMSLNMQVISITHLPQIASKGTYHYLVYKSDSENANVTGIKLLDKEERITEIAKMLSGSDISDAAYSNARELLGINK